jgi:glycosyltransferase involved in cell wall biosynthesis
VSGLTAKGPEVSVVICTRDRPELLRRVLASLEEQTIERSRFEVIVVDNGGGGIEELARTAGADIVVREHEPGLSRARNAGWRVAASELVAYLDDDAIAEKDWLEQALRVYDERNRAVAAMGGPALPLWDTPPPAWFPEDVENRWFGDTERVLALGESLSGLNVFFARALLHKLGGFDVRLGMRGDSIGVGEEADLFARMWAEDPHALAVYSPAIAIRHLVAPYKISVRYQLRRAVAYGESVIIQKQIPPAYRRHMAWEYLRDVFRLTRRALWRARPPLKRWALEELEPAAVRWGMLRAVVAGK